jgi:nucleotide-binding universal stress UspA family protein
MFDDILVPTDGSRGAETAAEYAEDVATRYDATVHALCVVDSRSLENAPHYDRLKAERTELAERACTNLSVTGVATERAVRTEVPHRAILEYADEQGIDLVVMGTHGRTGVERYLLGSVTEKVVRLADVPVLTVKAGDVTCPYSDILVPTDGSSGAAAAIEPAVGLASTYGARLHALSVVDKTATGLGVRPETFRERLDEAAREAVDAVERQAARGGVDSVTSAVERGHPYRTIRSYVDDQDVDLVVMGTRGQSGIEKHLLGSVTEKVVRTSSVPVMTVRD